MLTIAETPTFKAEADKLWSEDERLAFFSWLAGNPEAGDVIPGSGGCRKVRWSRRGAGKRGGVRVIYFVRVSAGVTTQVAETVLCFMVLEMVVKVDNAVHGTAARP